MTRAPQPVLIADADAELRARVARALQSAGHDVREAATGEEALEEARRLAPALAILDVRLTGVSGYAVCHALRLAHGPLLPIVFLSSQRRSSDRVAGLLLGADDYLTKPFSEDELLARVQALLRRAPQDGGTGGRLTSREREVLGLLTEGLDQGEIGVRLAISPKTVGTHITNVLRKLDVHSRTQAVAVAYREGLVGNGKSNGSYYAELGRSP